MDQRDVLFECGQGSRLGSQPSVDLLLSLQLVCITRALLYFPDAIEIQLPATCPRALVQSAYLPLLDEHISLYIPVIVLAL